MNVEIREGNSNVATIYLDHRCDVMMKQKDQKWLLNIYRASTPVMELEFANQTEAETQYRLVADAIRQSKQCLVKIGNDYVVDLNDVQELVKAAEPHNTLYAFGPREEGISRGHRSTKQITLPSKEQRDVVFDYLSEKLIKLKSGVKITVQASKVIETQV